MFSIFFVLILSPLLSVQCYNVYGGNRRHSHTHFDLGRRAGSASTFGYTGDIGPLLWAGLDAQNGACSTNNQQSPINFTPNTTPPISEAELPDLTFPNAESAKIVNNGNTLEVEMEGRGGTTCFRGKKYDLLQFHFHTPSEHLSDGEYHVLEMHMVHQASDGSVLVVGMFFDVQKENTTEFLTNVTSNLGCLCAAGSEAETGPLDFSHIINHFRKTDIMTYSGSLTTPPCSAGVTWVFAKTPLDVSLDTWREMKSIIKFNARFVQNDLGKENLISLAATNHEKFPNTENATETSNVWKDQNAKKAAEMKCSSECKMVMDMKR